MVKRFNVFYCQMGHQVCDCGRPTDAMSCPVRSRGRRHYASTGETVLLPGACRAVSDRPRN